MTILNTKPVAVPITLVNITALGTVLADERHSSARCNAPVEPAKQDTWRHEPGQECDTVGAIQRYFWKLSHTKCDGCFSAHSRQAIATVR